jgi:hypothetical protein
MPSAIREQLLKQVVVRALTSPVSLYLGATGLLLLATPATLPVGIALLVADAGWVWSRIRDPEYARVSSDERLRRRWRDAMERLEDLTAVLDRETAAALAEIVEAQERLLGVYGAEADGSRPLMPHTRTDLTQLLEHCLSLAEKRHRLQSYLASFRSQDVQRQVAQLQARLDQSHDAVTRQLYERAIAQKREELENYVRLEEAVARIDGQLTAVQCTFDNMLSRVVAMQTAHALSGDETSDPVVQELNTLASGVAALEASLDETLTLRGAA